jgi:TorA maturation chaperone TorD
VNAATSDLLGSFREGVALDLLVLAQLHDRELDRGAIEALKKDRFPDSLAFRLLSMKGREVRSALGRMTEDLVPDADLLDELAADFASVYLTHGIGASPCESVWLDEDGLAMQQPMFDVRASYARRGLCAQDWRKRPDDHLVYQLQFLACLFERKDPSALADAAQFLDQHTLRWLPDFARRVAQRAGTPFYAGLGMLTSVYLDELRDVLALILDQPRPTTEEVEQRARKVDEVPLPMPTAYVPGNSPSW